MKRKYLLGGLAVVALGLFGMMNLKQSITPYVSIAEAKNAKTTVQVNAKLVKHSSKYDMKTGILSFEVKDDKGDTMAVEHPKAPPANFEHAQGMVLIGEYTDNIFHAKELLVKCPSKYEKKAAK